MNGTKRPLPDWILERLHRGELPEARAAAVRAALDDGDRARLEALAASDAEILAAHPPARVAAEVQRRAAAARQPRRTWLWAPALAAGLAAAAFVLIPRAPAPDVTPAEETIGVKGLSPSLRIYRKTAAGAERLGAASRVRAGDTLQVRYVSAGRRYGVVASVDARGAVTLHLPESPGAAARLSGDGERALEHAFVLDATPGFERFVFVTGDRPFSTADVTRALEANERLAPALTTWELTLEKETR